MIKCITGKRCFFLVLVPCLVTFIVYSHFNEEMVDLQEKARLLMEEHYQRELARNKLNSIHVQKEADKYSNLHISPYKLPSEHASLPDEDGLWSSVQENNFYNFDQMLPSSSSEHENVADTIDEIRPMKTTTQKPATEAPQQTEKVTIQPVKKPVIVAPNHTGGDEKTVKPASNIASKPTPKKTVAPTPSKIKPSTVKATETTTVINEVKVVHPKRPTTSKYDDLPKGRVYPCRRRQVVFYNSVPKTGGTTLQRQFAHLSDNNDIDFYGIKTVNNYPRLSLRYQYSLVWNITQRTTQKPLVVQGHTAHIDFGQFGAFEPIYITVLREPLDRLLSQYYYKRNGDDYMKNWVWDKRNKRESFDDCVANHHADCATRHLWVQIPHLCGQNPACWEVNSEWALKEAKRKLLTKYFLVGVTEQMQSFIDVLDANLPDVFEGLAINYEKDSKGNHLRKTLNKEAITNSTIDAIKSSKTYQMERELYDFAQDQFNYVMRESTEIDDSDGKRKLITSREWEYYVLRYPKGKSLPPGWKETHQ